MIRDHLYITDEEAEANYDSLGDLMDEEAPTQTLELIRQKYPGAFSDASEGALSSAIVQVISSFINIRHQLIPRPWGKQGEGFLIIQGRGQDLLPTIPMTWLWS